MTDNKKKSGFDAPAIGTIHPKGSKIVKNPDGTITIVPPNETEPTTKNRLSDQPDLPKKH